MSVSDLQNPPQYPYKHPRVHLDRRLKTAAEFVRIDKRIADIGTDHAFIPCFLFQQGARALFACDILEGPLAAARATMNLYGIAEKTDDSAEGITLIRCDGLDGVPQVDDVIIAGMGGEAIADIISRCKYINKGMHFILQLFIQNSRITRIALPVRHPVLLMKRRLFAVRPTCLHRL